MIKIKYLTGMLVAVVIVFCPLGYVVGHEARHSANEEVRTAEIRGAEAATKDTEQTEQEKAAKAILKIANAWSTARETEPSASQALLIIAEPMEEAMLEYETPYTKGIVAPGE